MRLFYTTILILASNFFVFSQEEDYTERIKTIKIGYITEKINLTSDEAKEFWIVYDKYSQILHDLHNQVKECRKKGCEKKKNLTDAEAIEILKKDDELNDKIWQINKEKDKELLKIISAKKLILLKDAEREFYKRLMKQYREGKPQKKSN